MDDWIGVGITLTISVLALGERKIQLSLAKFDQVRVRPARTRLGHLVARSFD